MQNANLAYLTEKETTEMGGVSSLFKKSVNFVNQFDSNICLKRATGAWKLLWWKKIEGSFLKQTWVDYMA